MGRDNQTKNISPFQNPVFVLMSLAITVTLVIIYIYCQFEYYSLYQGIYLSFALKDVKEPQKINIADIIKNKNLTKRYVKTIGIQLPITFYIKKTIKRSGITQEYKQDFIFFVSSSSQIAKEFNNYYKEANLLLHEIKKANNKNFLSDEMIIKINNLSSQGKKFFKSIEENKEMPEANLAVTSGEKEIYEESKTNIPSPKIKDMLKEIQEDIKFPKFFTDKKEYEKWLKEEKPHEVKNQRIEAENILTAIMTNFSEKEIQGYLNKIQTDERRLMEENKIKTAIWKLDLRVRSGGYLDIIYKLSIILSGEVLILFIVLFSWFYKNIIGGKNYEC